MSNARVQQRGRQGGLDAPEGRHAGLVCCNDWFVSNSLDVPLCFGRPTTLFCLSPAAFDPIPGPDLGHVDRVGQNQFQHDEP
jgi:hypothetical protein